MQTLVIDGGQRLSGELAVQGAKNSALPLLAASVLCKDETVLKGCPKLTDVYAAARILTGLGCRCQMKENDVSVDSSCMNKTEIPRSLMQEMRSSIIFLGAVLGRAGECRLSFPGVMSWVRDPLICIFRRFGKWGFQFPRNTEL